MKSLLLWVPQTVSVTRPLCRVQPRQQRYRAQSLALVVPGVAGVLPGHRRKVGTFRCQGLHARLFIVRNRNPRRLAQFSPQALVDTQHHGVTVYCVGARDGLITHDSGSRVQQNPGSHRTPLCSLRALWIACSFSSSSWLTTKGLRFLGNAMPRLRHRQRVMSSYLQNH